MMNQSILIAPGAQPFFLSGGSTGILIIHGYGGSIGDYRSFADRLRADGYTVSGVRLAGHGRGLDELRRSSTKDWRQSVDQAMADLFPRTKNIIIVGASFGGILALDYVQRHPGRVAGIVTVNAPVIYRGGGRFQKFILRLLRLFIRDIPKRGLSPADRHWYAQLGSTLAWPINGILDTYQVIDHDVLPSLSSITAPVLLMANSDDPIVSKRSVDVLWRKLGSQHKQRLLIPGQTHRPFRDESAVMFMVDQVNRFIQGIAKNS